MACAIWSQVTLRRYICLTDPIHNLGPLNYWTLSCFKAQDRLVDMRHSTRLALKLSNWRKICRKNANLSCTRLKKQRWEYMKQLEFASQCSKDILKPGGLCHLLWQVHTNRRQCNERGHGRAVAWEECKVQELLSWNRRIGPWTSSCIYISRDQVHLCGSLCCLVLPKAEIVKYCPPEITPCGEKRVMLQSVACHRSFCITNLVRLRSRSANSTMSLFLRTWVLPECCCQ